MSLVIKMVVYLGVITGKFLEHCTTFKLLHAPFLVVEMAGANFHTNCLPGRHIIDDLQR